MNNDRPRIIAHLISLAIVIGGHVLLFMLFASRPATTLRQSRSPSPSTLLLLEPEFSKQEELPVIEATELIRSITVLPPERIDTSIASSTAIEIAPAGPRIDWHLEAQRSVEAMTPDLLEQLRRKCETDERPLPPECKTRNYEFDWDPEPSTVGMAGGLPYVRLGKRCILGLGFFGCALGKLPEPNGGLFETMRDPDRPRSSVPDVPR
jgi:hypothetical protein